VVVNRLWHWHTGMGIVATPSDFGEQGAEPTHPELIDHLAGELIDHGWRLKPIHRLIVTSAAYRRSSDTHVASAAKDPDNKLRWRAQRRRLEAEAIRDAMLAVAGRLDRSVGGPGTMDERSTRRSIYFFLKRSKMIPSLTLFDLPEPLARQGRRSSTTVAPQALMFLNSPHVRAHAGALADRVSAGGDRGAAVARLYRLTLSRAPAPGERDAALAFWRKQQAVYGGGGDERAALVDLCHSVLALNEFVYID